MAQYPRRNHRHRGNTTFKTPTKANRHLGFKGSKASHLKTAGAMNMGLHWWDALAEIFNRRSNTENR